MYLTDMQRRVGGTTGQAVLRLLGREMDGWTIGYGPRLVSQGKLLNSRPARKADVPVPGASCRRIQQESRRAE